MAIRKITKKSEVEKWWNEMPDKVRAATFIQQFLGANEKSSVYLMVNTTPNPKTIFKVGRKALEYLELKHLNSDFINVKYYQVLKFK